MTDIIHPGAGIIFMKVGTHAQEELEEIIDRKRQEIEDAGYALWGYGGTTCHPISMVQPFARSFEQRGSAIYLCMEPMESSHFAIPKRAREYSVDGLRWDRIPDAINVLGSRYALAIQELHQEEFELQLEQTRVAIGTSAGRVGSRYVQGRVDKACLEVSSPAPDEEPRAIPIGLVAKVVEPYAVIVRD